MSAPREHGLFLGTRRPHRLIHALAKE